MKKAVLTLMVIASIFAISKKTSGQAELASSSGVPYQSTSILYGSDVILNDQSSQNQRDVCLSVAYNGWLYACYSYVDGTTNKWVILLSQDDGVTWNIIREQGLSADWFVQALDMVVTGQSESDLRIIVGRILENDKGSSSNIIVSQLDGISGATLNTLMSEVITLPEKYLDIAVASDYLFPAENASPNEESAQKRRRSRRRRRRRRGGSGAPGDAAGTPPSTTTDA